MALFLITGVTGGIGGEVARALHRRGDGVLLAGRDPDRLDGLAAELPGARPVLMDLAFPGRLAAAVDGVDRLDGLVHCAGVVHLDPVAETGWQVWQDVLTVNLTAPAELTRALLPALRAAGGQVVFVNSGSGQRANPGWSAYSGSKFGLRALADSLRAEEAGNGVRVTTVYPGRTATRMQQRVRAAEGGGYEPANYLSAGTVATAVLAALDTPPGAELTEVTVRPTP